MNEFKDLIIEYWWHILAIGISPILGFIVAQYYKTYNKINKIKRNDLVTALVNGVVAGIIAAWFWPGSVEESSKIGLMIGIGGPVIVWLWFNIASRWAPEQVKHFKANEDTDEITIIPWVYRKKLTGKWDKPLLPSENEEDGDKTIPDHINKQ